MLLYDKALLDEEDILPASLLIFGKHPVPLVRQVGSRTFISPGEIGRRRRRGAVGRRSRGRAFGPSSIAPTAA